MNLRLLWLLAAGLYLIDAKSKGKVDVKKPADGWKEKTNEEGKVVQELKIEAPSMTEEDQYGYVMPERYKCDSCRAIMFHLDAALKKTAPKSRRMKSWEYTELFDDACKNSFEGYGIKLLGGQNTLSGPGLMHSEVGLAPGSGAIQMGGETWGKRLGEACRRIIYERIGEDELYEKYHEDGGLSEDICYKDLRDCVKAPHGPSTPPKKEEEAPKPKAKKADKEKEKKEKAKKKEEKKEKAKAKESKAAASAGASGDHIDAPAFLRNLAVRHGLDSAEYLTARSEKEWEKLIVAMAGRIFNKAQTEL